MKHTFCIILFAAFALFAAEENARVGETMHEWVFGTEIIYSGMISADVFVISVCSGKQVVQRFYSVKTTEFYVQDRKVKIIKVLPEQLTYEILG
jgi:hypothetical protein